MRIHIPFNAWSLERINKGIKRATSRTRRYGSPGDTFTTPGRTFVILAITKKKLGEVAEHHYLDEGAKTRDEFAWIWRTLHPKKGYNPEQLVYYHEFEPAK